VLPYSILRDQTELTNYEEYVLNIFNVCLHYYLSYPTCKTHIFYAVLYCHQWPVWLYHIFPHYLINNSILERVFGQKMCFEFLYTFLSGTFLVLRRMERGIITNVCRSSCQFPAVLVIFNETWIFDRFSKNPQIQNFMKIRPVGDEVLYADRRTDMTKIIVAFRNFANVPNKRRTSVTSAEFETPDPKKQMRSDLRLRPHGHRDRPKCIFKCDIPLWSKRT
jgi:hypothetical protein